MKIMKHVGLSKDPQPLPFPPESTNGNLRLLKTADGCFSEKVFSCGMAHKWKGLENNFPTYMW